jgi:hypothetical protein
MDKFEKVDRSAIKKVNINEAESDFNFWQSQSFEYRLETLENIREEYNRWKYSSQQRLQRVYTIIKRT